LDLGGLQFNEIIFESFDVDRRGDIENGIPTNRFFLFLMFSLLIKDNDFLTLSITKAKYML
jgi:hypothetical protein